MESDKRILCVGICVLDIIYKYSHYPKEDTKLSCNDGYWARGGNASNNCTVLDYLGAACEFLGFITNSPNFSFLIDDFHQSGIIIKNCPTTTMYPPFSSIIVTENGSRTIFHCRVPDYPRIEFEHFNKCPLQHYKWIHFDGRKLLPTLHMIKKIQKYNNEIETPIMISVELEQHTNGENLIKLALNVNVVFISKDMAQSKGWLRPDLAVYGMRKEMEIETENAQNKSTNANLPHIICPWGENGADCLSSNGEWSTHPSVKLSMDKIIDTLGAGDTFIAAFIHAFSNLGKDLKQAVNYANHIAAFKIQHQGFSDIKYFSQ